MTARRKPVRRYAVASEGRRVPGLSFKSIRDEIEAASNIYYLLRDNEVKAPPAGPEKIPGRTLFFPVQ